MGPGGTATFLEVIGVGSGSELSKGSEMSKGSEVSRGSVVSKGAATPAALEAAIAARRDHLAATLDELVQRAQPANLARSSVAGARRGLAGATHTPEGGLRTERIAAVAGAVLAVLVALLVLRSRRSR